jgi:hypothetical protein
MAPSTLDLVDRVLFIVGIAASTEVIMRGAAWGFPLADLVWWLAVLMLCEGSVATLIASILGTPGCEIGVWSEWLARMCGEDSETHTTLASLVSRRRLDASEAVDTPDDQVGALGPETSPACSVMFDRMPATAQAPLRLVACTCAGCADSGLRRKYRGLVLAIPPRSGCLRREWPSLRLGEYPTSLTRIRR